MSLLVTHPTGCSSTLLGILPLALTDTSGQSMSAEHWLLSVFPPSVFHSPPVNQLGFGLEVFNFFMFENKLSGSWLVFWQPVLLRLMFQRDGKLAWWGQISPRKWWGSCLACEVEGCYQWAKQGLFRRWVCNWATLYFHACLVNFAECGPVSGWCSLRQNKQRLWPSVGRAWELEV